MNLKLFTVRVISTGILLSYTNLLSDFPMPRYTGTECMTANIFFEARGESIKGMQAVAAVTYNRLKSKLYPKDVCSVVFDKNQFSWVKQVDFKYARNILEGDLSDLNQKDTRQYYLAKQIAQQSVKEVSSVLPKGTMWYHTLQVKPRWAKSKIFVKKIGRHLFYTSKKEQK
jgi:spore germination cell wall hydrolase CwlJ-like protein